MKVFRLLVIAVVAVFSATSLFAGDNLKLNPKLDYTSDSHDGPLITGDHMDNVLVSGRPNYVIIFGEACFNSKRQARRTVELFRKYSDKVNFVILDLDKKHSPAQQELIDRFFEGYIPHVVVISKNGKVIYNQPGEVDEDVLAQMLEKDLSSSSQASARH